MPLEERLYRFPCVEAWCMNVPWRGRTAFWRFHRGNGMSQPS